MTDPEQLGRRQFASRLVAGSGAFAGLLAADAHAQDDPPAAAAKDVAKEEQVAEPPRKPALESLLLAYLVQRYPSEQFDETALRGIHADLRADIARGRVLSDFPLNNSDAPAQHFRVYRAAD